MPHIRPYESISVQGQVVPAKGTILLKPVKKSKNIRDGFLRVHNMSDQPQTIMPSQTAQKQWSGFTPHIEGDDSPASMPMAWNNSDLRFEIISMNNSLLPNGTRELERFNEFTEPASTWTMQEIICAVKELPGSRPPGPNNPNNYMGYDRTNWQIFNQEVQEGTLHDVDGIVLDETLVLEGQTSVTEMAYVVETLEKKLAFVVEKSNGAIYHHKSDTLGIFLDNIGTSGCISLIQKAIRRRPATMRHPEDDETFKTTEIVERIVRRMCCGRQAGFFLPLIGKFVTPLQHFLKRLFIIAAEDSEYCKKKMFFISMKALLACSLPHWRPSSGLIDKFVETALWLLDSSLTSHYDTSVELPLSLEFVVSAPARVQAELGGMGGDQKMLRWLAKKQDDHNSIGTAGQPLNGEDPLDIYCDQHQEGRLVCFLQTPETTKQPNVFQKAEEAAFFAVSGHNTRRSTRLQTRTPEQQMVFDGLCASSKLLRRILPSRTRTGSAEKVWSVPEEALAGMVGSLEVCQDGGRYFVTISTHNIGDFVVIPKPSRDNKKHMSDITPELRDKIVATATQMLHKGVTATNVSDESFKGATIRLVEGKWLVRGKPWSEARSLTSKLSKPVDWTKLTGPHEGPWPWTETFGDNQIFRPEVIQWCIGRMAGYGNTVGIPKINRTGAGTDEALTGLEAEGYQFLMHLSEHYPDALWPMERFKFETKCMALRKEICSRLAASANSTCEWPQWTSQLPLRETQELAFNEMRLAHEQGLANFLWMLVGQGKSLTVLKFLETTRACKHIIWSLPKTAVGSVAEIIHEVGWEPLLLFPSKGLQTKYKKEETQKKKENKAHKIWDSTTDIELKTKKVILVEHDHLRKLADSLASQMGDTAFIFDEVHKAMQTGTQRTAAALRLARLAKQLVALTGTPIVDKSGYGLMEWLRLCVPFPVTTTNFWTAANSMVTQLNSGDVTVTEEVIDVDMTPDDVKFFKNNTPARQPWFGKTEVPTREQWSEMRAKTNEICDKEMVNMAITMYHAHPEDWREDHAQALQGNSNSQRPLIVAQNQKHACHLIDKLLLASVKAEDILLVGGARPAQLHMSVPHHKTIHLTEIKVLKGDIHPFKVVVAALRNCEGYSLTWMTCQISGSYPSNQASRTQMRGRINRIDAQRRDKTYWTVLAGVTTITHRYQEAAKLVEDALRANPKKKKKKKKESTTTTSSTTSTTTSATKRKHSEL